MIADYLVPTLGAQGLDCRAHEVGDWFATAHTRDLYVTFMTDIVRRYQEDGADTPRCWSYASKPHEDLHDVQP